MSEFSRFAWALLFVWMSPAQSADFTGAKMGADMKNQSMGLMRTDLSGANLSGADFSGADLGRALLRFANLTGAKLIGASLSTMEP